MAGYERNVDKLKALLGIQDGQADMELEFALENAEETVKNYCHVDEIPAGLSTTIFRMAMDIYRNEQPGSAGVPMDVKSISEGDTSTSFGTVSTDGYGQSLLKAYQKQLNNYRRVRF